MKKKTPLFVDSFYLGTKEDVKQVKLDGMKPAFIVGIIFILFSSIYEASKLAMKTFSDAVVYANYPLLTGYSFLSRLFLVTVCFVIVVMFLTAMIRLSFDQVSNANAAVAIVSCLVVFLGLTIFLSGLRFIVDILLLRTNPPLDAWIFRFYRDSTLVVEWKVIPDIIMNGVLVFGAILSVFPTLTFIVKASAFNNVMESGLKTGGETVMINGNEASLECKERNGIKACKIGNSGI